MSGIGVGFFHSSSAFSPSDTVYTASTSITVPDGATQIIAEVIGAGGGGGAGVITGGPFCGGGGGGGAYASVTKSLSGDSGKTITITVGTGGAGGVRSVSAPTSGGLSRVAATGLTNAIQITGGGGLAATNASGSADGLLGAGGTASQETGTGATLTNGTAGDDGDGNFPPAIGGAGKTFSGGGTTYGTGGDGVNTTPGVGGLNGAVRIRFS